jgi:hypothetical protein
MGPIDGSKFKAVKNRDKNLTTAKIQKGVEQVEARIDRYLFDLDAADRQEGEVARAKSSRLKEMIAALRAHAVVQEAPCGCADASLAAGTKINYVSITKIDRVK